MSLQNKQLINRLSTNRIVDLDLRPPFPSKRLNIEISNICNHECLFCPSKSMTRKKRFIDESLLYRLLQESYTLGMREVALYIWGDPFMSENLHTYIKKAKDIGFTYIYLTTNGALATPERLKKAVDSGLDSIKFSINAGSRETYKLIHGKDDFNTVIENLKFCWSYREKTNSDLRIYLSCVVSKYMGGGEIDAYKEKLARYSDEVDFYECRNLGGHIPEFLEQKYTQTSGDRKYLLPTFEGCIRPFNSVSITCEGYLVACCMDLNNQIIIADLNETSLFDAWNSERMLEIRKALIDNRLEGLICSSCLEYKSTEARILDI